MSDTPRTDVYRSIAVPKAEDNWAAFARILERELATVTAERDQYRAALERIAGCDWVISLPDRMDAVRKIAQDAMRGEPTTTKETTP